MIFYTNTQELCIPVVHNQYSEFKPFTPKSDLIDFNLSNARRFYSSKGNPLGVKGLRITLIRVLVMEKLVLAR